MHQQSIYSCLLLFFYLAHNFVVHVPVFSLSSTGFLESVQSTWTFSEVGCLESVWPLSHLCQCASVYNVSIALSFSCHCEVVLHHDHVSMLSSCTTSGNRPVWSVCWVACSCVCVTQNDICLATGDESWSDCLVPHRFLVTCLASYPDMFAPSTWVDSALVTSF